MESPITQRALMTTATFDTHAAVKKLQAAGFSEQQAETQIAVLADAVGAGTATKQDKISPTYATT